MEFDKINSPEKLLDYMHKNIKYGFVGKNKKIYTNQDSEDWNDWYDECVIQTGKDVLNTKVGTCWDQVELERMWFEKYNYEIKTIFIWFEVNFQNDYPTHTFLLFKKNDKWNWFENAFASCRGIHEFDTVEEAIDYVKEKQLEYVKDMVDKNIDDTKYIKAYEYSKLNKSLTVEEYINHVTIKSKNY